MRSGQLAEIAPGFELGADLLRLFPSPHQNGSGPTLPRHILLVEELADLLLGHLYLGQDLPVAIEGEEVLSLFLVECFEQIGILVQAFFMGLEERDFPIDQSL